jgi:hypothetical protein
LFYQEVLKYIDESKIKALQYDQIRIKNDIDYVLTILSKFGSDTKGMIFLKDGIMFIHLESLYEKGLNQYTLHWRDKDTSIYYEDASSFFV